MFKPNPKVMGWEGSPGGGDEVVRVEPP